MSCASINSDFMHIINSGSACSSQPLSFLSLPFLIQKYFSIWIKLKASNLVSLTQLCNQSTGMTVLAVLRKKLLVLMRVRGI